LNADDELLNRFGELAATQRVERRLETLVLDLLEVADALDRLCDSKLGSADHDAFMDLRSQFDLILGRHDVVAIDCQNQAFDPALHEAHSSENSSLAHGTILGVVRRGYRFDEEILRPPLVVVSAGPGDDLPSNEVE
jgi:molecular chaperone GrpE